MRWERERRFILRGFVAEAVTKSQVPLQAYPHQGVERRVSAVRGPAWHLVGLYPPRRDGHQGPRSTPWSGRRSKTPTGRTTPLSAITRSSSAGTRLKWRRTGTRSRCIKWKIWPQWFKWDLNSKTFQALVKIDHLVSNYVCKFFSINYFILFAWSTRELIILIVNLE